jgi:hypothetical protein
MPRTQGPRRAPAGVVTKKPVSMRLLPDERAMLLRLSERENRSIASMARRVYLEGLPHVLRKPTNK